MYSCIGTRTAWGSAMAAPYRVNGRSAEEREGLPPNATVTGPDFSFAVEPAKR